MLLSRLGACLRFFLFVLYESCSNLVDLATERWRFWGEHISLRKQSHVKTHSNPDSLKPFRVFDHVSVATFSVSLAVWQVHMHLLKLFRFREASEFCSSRRRIIRLAITQLSHSFIRSLIHSFIHSSIQSLANASYLQMRAIKRCYHSQVKFLVFAHRSNPY